MPLLDALPNLFALRLHFIEQCFFVQAQVLSLIDKYLTIDDHGPHIPAHRGVPERSAGSAHCAAGYVAQVDAREIGLGAFRPPATLIAITRCSYSRVASWLK